MSPLSCKRVFSKLVTRFKSRCQSLACLPLLPSSPRVSPNLLHKRKARHRSPADSSPSISQYTKKSPSQIAMAVASNLVNDQASPSSRMHLSSRKIDDGELSPALVERKAPTPFLKEGKRGHPVKLTVLLVLLFAFLSIGKITAFGITSSAFVLLKLIWNVRLRGFPFLSQSYLASFIYILSPATRNREEQVCNKKSATFHDLETSLSVKMPCQKIPPVIMSVPLTKFTTSVHSVHASAGSRNRIGPTGNVSYHSGGSDPNHLSWKSFRMDSKHQSGMSVPSTTKIEQRTPKGRKNDAVSSKGGRHSVLVAFLVILGGLLLGRVFAIFGFSCWILLVAKLPQRSVKLT